MTNYRIEYITNVRVFATLLVILFHSYAPYFYNIGLNLDFPYVSIYKDIFILEETIQMPLFVFLSGYLFTFLHRKGKYKSFSELMRKKVQRLLLPYIVFGILIYFSIPKSVQESTVVIERIQHLWFLLMLFECFIFHNLMLSLGMFCKKRIIILFVIALIMMLSWRQIPHILCLPALFNYYIFFIMGGVFLLYEERLSIWSKTRQSTLIVSVAISYILLSVVYLLWFYDVSSLGAKILSHFVRLITSMTGIVLIMILFRFVFKTVKIEKLDRASMGMYIFHYWIMLNVLDTPQISAWGKEHHIIFPIIMFIFLTSTSYITTRILLRVPYINKLI